MMIYKTNDQVELMRQSALLVSKTLTEIAGTLKPGITTLSIDKKIGEFIRVSINSCCYPILILSTDTQTCHYENDEK